MRSVIARTSRAPSGWQNAPATPHISASHPGCATPESRAATPDEPVIDEHVGLALVRPPELVLDTQASFSAHVSARVIAVEEVDDREGVGRHVPTLYVARGAAGRNPGLLEIECDDGHRE